MLPTYLPRRSIVVMLVRRRRVGIGFARQAHCSILTVRRRRLVDGAHCRRRAAWSRLPYHTSEQTTVTAGRSQRYGGLIDLLGHHVGCSNLRWGVRAQSLLLLCSTPFSAVMLVVRALDQPWALTGPVTTRRLRLSYRRGKSGVPSSCPQSTYEGRAIPCKW